VSDDGVQDGIENRLFPIAAPPLSVEAAQVRVGTCSWADATLTKESDWYPRRSMKAAERLAYYSSKFPVVEVDSTYYFPPTPELSQSWVDRSPDGFVFDVKAWSLLTGHPTFPHSLFPDLTDAVKPEFRDKRNLYDKHLAPEARDECWERFRHALEPLYVAGRLGGVLLQYPDWMGPKESSRRKIREAVEMLHPYPCFIEFRNRRWLEGDERDATLDFLEDEGLPFVCVDEPQGFESSVPPIVAATSPLSIIRFHGHNTENWTKRGITAAERFRYDYSQTELDEWSVRLRTLASSADEVHVLFNNCWQDYAVRNAATMQDLLGSDVGSDVGLDVGLETLEHVE
jgi:uncharacterized protein YecE (DUF72 family)